MDLRKIKGKDNKIAFLKEVYNFCEECDWDVEKTEEYGQDLDATGKEVRRMGKIYLTRYMSRYVDIADEEIDLKVEEINKKIRQSVSKRALVSLTHDNVILKEQGISTQKLWNNDEEKEIVLEYIYKYCESTKYYFSKGDELSERLGLGASYEKVFKLAEIYATEYLMIPKEEYQNYRKQIAEARRKNPKKAALINELFDKLLKENDFAKQYELISKSKVSVGELNSRAFDWSVSYGKQDDCAVLREIIFNYSQKRNDEKLQQILQKKKQKREAKVKEASMLVTNFLNSNMPSINMFCTENNINKKEFSEYVGIIEEKNPDLFSKYTERVDKLNAQRYLILLEKMQKIISHLKNGVQNEDGTTRKFDIMDYFSITKLEYDKLLVATKQSLSVDEIRTFVKFSNENKIERTWGNNDIKNCFAAKCVIGFVMDEKGKVTNPGHELTNNEKENIINYIKQLNVPLCDNTYSCVLRKYSKGEITFEEKNNKLLKKNS